MTNPSLLSTFIHNFFPDKKILANAAGSLL